jgi:hypothetical protein
MEIHDGNGITTSNRPDGARSSGFGVPPKPPFNLSRNPGIPSGVCPGALAAWCHGAQHAVATRGTGATRWRGGRALFFLSVKIFNVIETSLLGKYHGILLKRRKKVGYPTGGTGSV